MKAARVIYHQEPDGWWAESPDIERWYVAGDTYAEVVKLAEEGVAFALGRKLCDHLYMSFTRITVRSDQMGGVPCVRNLRIPVATVVGMVADGTTEPEILAAYPDLEGEDIREAVRYAAEAVRERELPLVASG